MVCLGLGHVEHPNGRYQRESVQRAIDWILSMQCRNGGWASFDKNNDRMVFQYVGQLNRPRSPFYIALHALLG